MSRLNQFRDWLLRRMLGLIAASLCASVVMNIYFLIASDSAAHAERTFSDQVIFFLLGIVVLWPYTLFWILIALLLFGTPILAVFRWKKVTHWLAFAAGGLVVGAVSWLLPWYIEDMARRPSAADRMGPLFAFEFVYVFALAGFLCGLVYWFFACRKRAPASAQATD